MPELGGLLELPRVNEHTVKLGALERIENEQTPAVHKNHHSLPAKISYVLRTIAGLRVDRQVWGLTPWDLGFLGRRGKRARLDTSEIFLLESRMSASEVDQLSLRREAAAPGFGHAA